MTDDILEIISALFVFAGALLTLGSAIGLVRFRDTLSRMHPAAKPQVLGLVLVLFGAIVRAAVSAAGIETEYRRCRTGISAWVRGGIDSRCTRYREGRLLRTRGMPERTPRIPHSRSMCALLTLCRPAVEPPSIRTTSYLKGS